MKKRDARRRGKQRGISLTEAILGVAVLGVGLGSIASLQVDNIQNIKVETSAQQLAIVREGAERFVRDNIAAIIAGIPAAGDTAIIPDNQLDGWLPPAVFNGGEIRANPYGQDTVVSVRNMGIGPTGQTRVGVFVTTRGGQVIPDEQLASIAAAAGAQAGFRVAADGLYDDDTIQGAYGAWQIATADLEAGAEPSPGGLAAVAYFGEGGVLADFLYRNPVPGQPQAQQMNANIDMNDFGIASLRQINGTIDTAVTGNAPAPVLPVAGTPIPPDVLMVGDVNAASGSDDYARGGAGLYAGEVRSETLRTEGFVNSLSQVVTGQLDAAGAPTGANVAISAGLDETGAAAADPRVGMRVVDAAANERIAAVVDDGAGFSGVRLFDDALNETVTIDGQSRETIFRDDANLARVRVASAGGEIAVSDGDVAALGAAGGLAGLRMRGSGLFEGFDSSGRLRSRLDAETATVALQDDAGVESVFVDGQGRQFVMRDSGARDRAVVNGEEGSITLNRLQSGIAERALELRGQRIRFGPETAPDDWVELRRVNIGAEPEMRLQVGGDSDPVNAFSVGVGQASAGGYRPRFRTDMSGRTQFSDSANRLRAELRADDAALGLLDDAGTENVLLDGQIGLVRANTFRAASGPPSAADNSVEGYAFGTDGDTGLFRRDATADNVLGTTGRLALFGDNNEIANFSREGNSEFHGRMDLTREVGGVNIPSIRINPDNQFIQFGEDAQNTDRIRLQRVDAGADESQLRLVLGDDPAGNPDSFIIGTGNASFTQRASIRSDGRMEITAGTSDGFIQIGRTDLDTDNAAIRVRNPDGRPSSIYFGNDSDDRLVFPGNNDIDNFGTNQEQWTFETNGSSGGTTRRVIIGDRTGFSMFNNVSGAQVETARIARDGVITGTGLFLTSDETLKQDIIPVEDALARIRKLEGVQFNWKDTGDADVGLIAQNVAEIFPELVMQRDDGKMVVKYPSLIGALVEAIKELDTKSQDSALDELIREKVRADREQFAHLLNRTLEKTN